VGNRYCCLPTLPGSAAEYAVERLGVKGQGFSYKF